MTALLRCRGSTVEMTRQFDAAADAMLAWRETIWTGDRVPVVLADGDSRRLTTSTWGLPDAAYGRPVGARQRGTLYARDLVPASSRLRDPSGLLRCLIVIESFAYPDGAAGERTRTWFGLCDDTLAAWAGFCLADDDCCAGLLTVANACVRMSGDTMPLLLPPAAQATWLEGGGLLSLGATYAPDAFYRENLGERWSTGRPDDDDGRTGEGGGD